MERTRHSATPRPATALLPGHLTRYTGGLNAARRTPMVIARSSKAARVLACSCVCAAQTVKEVQQTSSVLSDCGGVMKSAF